MGTRREQGRLRSHIRRRISGGSWGKRCCQVSPKSVTFSPAGCDAVVDIAKGWLLFLDTARAQLTKEVRWEAIVVGEGRGRVLEGTSTQY